MADEKDSLDVDPEEGILKDAMGQDDEKAPTEPMAFHTGFLIFATRNRGPLTVGEIPAEILKALNVTVDVPEPGEALVHKIIKELDSIMDEAAIESRVQEAILDLQKQANAARRKASGIVTARGDRVQ